MLFFDTSIKQYNMSINTCPCELVSAVGHFDNNLTKLQCIFRILIIMEIYP